MPSVTDASDSDETLMARYARGEAAAFESLYRRHEMRIWRYLYRNVGNRATADDVLQDVWFAVAREAPRYRPSARFTTWLFTLAHHRMVDAFRARRPHESLEAMGYEAAPVVAQLTEDQNAGPFATAVARDQLTALTKTLESLPNEQREAFLLQVEGDLSIEDIAVIMRSSAETTKSRLRYARAKLRELLREYA
jgi:RNA polymerase sigma factor (sigma-70 family)